MVAVQRMSAQDPNLEGTNGTLEQVNNGDDYSRKGDNSVQHPNPCANLSDVRYLRDAWGDERDERAREESIENTKYYQMSESLRTEPECNAR